MADDISSHYRRRLKCKVPQIDAIFAGVIAEALSTFSAEGLDAFLAGADTICGLGRGQELVLIFLEGMPAVAEACGESVTTDTVAAANFLSESAHGPAINPFLATLPAVARRLGDGEMLLEWYALIEHVARVGGKGLVPLLQSAPRLFAQLNIAAVHNWVDYGLKGYRNQPHRIGEYFALQSADSVAALQRERHGTLFMDNERSLSVWLRSLWGLKESLIPYSAAFSSLRRPMPYLDRRGFHLPDLMENAGQVPGIDRYRATLAHLAAHRIWSKPFLADNYSAFQHLAIETFEDARVEALAIERYPGLRRLWMALHPIPVAEGCPAGYAPIRHQLAMLSRAILDPDHDYTDVRLLTFVDRFRRAFAADPEDAKLSIKLGIAWLAEFYTHEFRRPQVWFEDTEVSYRDDNRYLWMFLEAVEDEDEFHSDHGAADFKPEAVSEVLLPQHYPEWDHGVEQYRPDWVSLYESIYPRGEAQLIDGLLEKHHQLAKSIQRIIDRLKPQRYQRVRFQEDGDALDLDPAIRALIDLRSGVTPNPRLHYRHQHAGRDIAVTLLLDLSESINSKLEGCESTVLQLSQEAVALLAWAIDALGDQLEIAGFASNTRHEVRYQYFKRFAEVWDEEPKSRLAMMQGGFSTRMGAAIRHAGHSLAQRQSEKRLLLLLTDGEPHDIDVAEPDYLIEDAKRAVREIDRQGIAAHCISLDPHADPYVSHIFGQTGYTVIDRIERLPERLPQLFLKLTG